MQVYKDVIERLLFTLSEEEDSLQSKPDLLVQESNLWPDWPWPPWGDGDHDDEGKPVNKSEEAHRLAKEVVKFETQLAQASLDLQVFTSTLTNPTVRLAIYSMVTQSAPTTQVYSNQRRLRV